MEFQQILKELGFSHEPLRLQLALLELKGTQKDQKHVYTSKLSPNQKIRIKTTLHQFWDKAARSLLWLHRYRALRKYKYLQSNERPCL